MEQEINNNGRNIYDSLIISMYTFRKDERKDISLTAEDKIIAIEYPPSRVMIEKMINSDL